MAVDLKGFRQKMDKAGGLVPSVRMLLQDAGQYMEARLRDDVLNGETGKDYPKSYPASVTQGGRGYVGVISSNLRDSIQTYDRGEVVLIISDPRAAPVAEYNIKIDDWAREKYGMGYFEIAVELYGGFIEKAFVKEIARFARAMKSGQRYNYQNPFPA